MRTLQEAENYFVYHAPTPEQRQQYERLNEMWLDTLHVLWDEIPPYGQPSPDKTVMIRQLADMRMKANLVVACYVEPEQSTLPPPQGDIPAPKFSDPTSKGY